ncbi:hypothetical protein [Phycicoccus sp. Soil748]|uniref:hypothetical protein n=1 Tax=Phycicoccus sp. Soil748 TaxID=1736397 RepID=UPI000702E546|nr:hypothetical protein [Phycicoccus sp. Soil748]KRE58871.1 hypothetical protein ASG70_16625 [Phycicoccus sp. Soil748]
MTIHVAGPTLVRSSSGTGDWTVWAVEQRAGVARVERRPDLIEVVVADAPAGDGSEAGFTAVACTAEGEAMVLRQAAPPALLVGASSCRTAPADPGGRELVAMGPDELLLLLSASALEARPAVLSQNLQSPAHLLDLDPARLLAELFTDVPYGAGAMLRRCAPTPTELEEPTR